MAASDEGQVGIRLIAVDQQYAVPDAPLAVPASLNRFGLSEVVNQMLELEKRVPFDFSINGQLIRSSLAKHLAEKGVSKESIIEVQYFPALQAPQLESEQSLPDWLSSVCMLGSTPISACYDGHMRLHSADDGSITHEVQVSADSLTSIAARSGKGGSLAVGSSDGGVHVYSPAQEEGSAPAHMLSVRTVDAVQSVAIVGSGRNSIVFAGAWSGMVQGWHVEALSTQAAQQSNSGAGKAARGSKRRAGADSAAPGGVSDISPTVELLGHKSAVSGIVALPAGGDNLLATGSWDHSVRVWDCVGGGVELDTYACNKVVSCLAAAPESAPGAGYLFATGHPDHLVRLWDSRTAAGQTGRMSESGRPTALPAAHTSWVTSMAWHPSRAHMFASGAQDGTVRVWDTRSAKPLFTLHSHAEKEEGEYEPASAKATKESAADQRPALAPEGVKILGLAWGDEGGKLWSGGSDAEIHMHGLPGGHSREF